MPFEIQSGRYPKLDAAPEAAPEVVGAASLQMESWQ
jgi:hypothetical protein